jgi:hypothetical protein
MQNRLRDSFGPTARSEARRFAHRPVIVTRHHWEIRLLRWQCSSRNRVRTSHTTATYQPTNSWMAQVIPGQGAEHSHRDMVETVHCTRMIFLTTTDAIMLRAYRCAEVTTLGQRRK